MLEEKNTFHVREKDQKEFGFDNSYAYKELPIGAPNAALTAAAIPAAISFLLSLSFLKY